MNYNETITQLNHIKKKLHENNPLFGNISVLVGSGFSKNSTPIGTKTTQYPSWAELAEKIIINFYTDESKEEQDEKLELCKRPEDIMEILQEYVVNNSRKDLDNLIEKYIPDNEYEPNELYNKLLNLPFKDIFTTNYDTLLERAAKKLKYKSYKIITTEAQLLGAGSPRIIKLHGSFPNDKPYIITEEDYRRYAQTHEIFKNVIQSSLISDELILIGFSGNDPNFKNWIGWINDKFENKKQSIYLCTFEKIAESKKNALISKGIKIINLNEILKNEIKDNIKNKYYATYEWMFEYLQNYDKIDENANWPNKFSDIKHINYTKKFNEKDLDNLVKQLAEYKNSYPGWILIPQENQNNLNRKIYYLDSYLENKSIINSQELNPETLIKLINLLFWCYRHIYKSITVKACENIRLLSNKIDISKINNKTELIDFFINLYCDARENLEIKIMKDLESKIMSLNTQSSELQKNWFKREKILFEFKLGNISKNLQDINSWKLNEDNLSINLLFKISFLLEIGELEKANNILLKVISKIKHEDLTIYKKSFFSICFYLARIINKSDIFEQKKLTYYVNILHNNQLNPQPIINKLIEKLKQYQTHTPIIKKSRRKNFDPYTFNHSESIHSDDYSIENEIINFFDYNPIPPRINNYTIIDMNLLKIPIQTLSLQALERALSLFIRFREPRNLENVFNRYTVFYYDVEKLNNIKLVYYNSLKELINLISSNNIHYFIQENTINCLLSIISYLIPTINITETNEYMILLIKLESASDISEKTLKIIQTCMGRIIDNKNFFNIANIETINLYFNRKNINNKDLSDYIYYYKVRIIDINLLKEHIIIETSLVDKLFIHAFEDKQLKNDYQNEFIRLFSLYNLKLTNYKFNSFCKILFNNVENVPINYYYVALNLLNTQKYNIREIIEKNKLYLLEMINSEEINKTNLKNQIIKLINLHEWAFNIQNISIYTETEAIVLLTYFNKIWKKNKSKILKEIDEKNNNPWKNLFISNQNISLLIKLICKFLNQCILTQIDDYKKYSSILLKSFNELMKVKLICYELVLHSPKTSKIEYNLLINKNDRDIRRNIFDSIMYRLIYINKDKKIKAYLYELMHYIIDAIEYNKGIDLYEALDKINYLYEKKTNYFSNSFINKLIRGIIIIENYTSIEEYETINKALLDNNFDILEKSDIRAMTSRLTKNLYNNQSLNTKQLEELTKYKEIFKKDKLPEVKQYWK